MSPDTPLAIVTAPKRDSLHWTAGVVTWGEVCGWAADPAKKKEAGSYILGTLRETAIPHERGQDPCTGLHRRKDAVVSRAAITLDVDYADRGFADTVELVFPYAALLHDTYSSTPDAPRYRLVIPTDRAMAPDEYVAAARAVMGMLGTQQFDPGSSQPERYMFRPAAARREWYGYRVLPGETLAVDAVLADFEEDLSAKPVPRPSRFKRDPFELEGVIGAFNRAYADWDLLIHTYGLPYDKVAEDRYQLVGARSQAGMGPVRDADGLVYSHHANDPAYGQACSAFDLARLHRFGELDETASEQTPVNRRPSHLAMLDLAAGDHRVTAELVGLDFEAVMAGEVTGEAWKLDLARKPRTGEIVDVNRNWMRIRDNDPVFALFAYNDLTLSVELTAAPPWRAITPTTATVTGTDRWEMLYHIEETYGVRPSKVYLDALIDTRAKQISFNPIRDYLEQLVWDKVPRVEECLPGVTPTPYTRFVARKAMVAAVARMLDPGCKWDHALVLYGPEGLGKSWWIDKIAKGYSSTLGDIRDKDTLLTMQRSWIMVSDEGHALRKSDHDQQKEFLTRTHDLFRLPYDREVQSHPRHCVVWSTTNDETFLRRQEGNRRFLIVHCERRVAFDEITPAYIDQLWAEALYLYRQGERLYLGDMEAQVAAGERERFTEEDSLRGLIEEYLETPVPADWWERSPTGRRQWLADRSDGFEPPGTMPIDSVCSAQIWVEALGQRHGQARRGDLLDIVTALRRMPGWRAVPTRRRVSGYGPQLVFVRDPDNIPGIAP